MYAIDDVIQQYTYIHTLFKSEFSANYNENIEMIMIAINPTGSQKNILTLQSTNSQF